MMMLHTIDEQGLVVAVSDPWLAKLGYSREKVLGRSCRDFFAPGSRERISDEILPQSFQCGSCENVQLQMLCRDGRTIDVLQSGIVNGDSTAGGRVLFAAVIDVTLLKETERQLAESEARYRNLVEHQSELISLATPDGDLLYVNRAYASFYEKQPREMIGRNLFDFIPANCRAMVAHHFQEVCRANHSVEMENQVVLPSGQKRRIAWTNKALVDGDGTVTAIHSAGRDIEWRVAADERLKESEQRYRLLAENSTDMIVIVGRDGRRSYVSPACRTLLGYEPEEMLQIRTQDSVHPDDVPIVQEVLANRQTNGTLTYRMRRKDGSYVWVEAAGGPRQFVGQADQHITVIRNVDERIAAEERLADANRRLQMLTDEASKKSNQLEAAIANISQGLCMFDAEQRLLIHNDRYIEMYGLPRDLVVPGCSFRSILEYRKATGSFAGDVDEFIVQISMAHAERHPHHVTTRAKGGRTIAVINQPMPGGGWVATHEDVTERRRAEAKIERLAHFDALTSLANRNLFREKIDEALARWRRFSDEFAIFLIDLDKFKQVNDSFGHQTGDALLQAVAARLRESIREVDVAARLGGDEFALIVAPGREGLLDGSQKLGARLLERIGAPYDIEGQQIIIGSSIGIALAPKHGELSDELLKNADLALYKCKKSGRNCFHVFSDELRLEADTRNELENDLRQAIWREEFSVCYQPFVSLETRHIQGVEALARWRHPTKGLIPPDQFIPLAEEAGLIAQLGEWVLTKACHDAMKMPDHFKIAVNISPSQFGKSNLVDTVIFALVDSQLSPERLEIEITEGVLLGETTQNLETLRQLQNLGVSIALDDFGVGYSSLSYLTSFPFNKVKIDKSFVGKVETPEALAVVKSVVQLAKTLRLSSCAEGIETQEQLLDIKSIGVEVGQGYLFGRPVPLDELLYPALDDGSTIAA